MGAYLRAAVALGPGVVHAKRTKQGVASREGETIEKLDTLVHEFVDDLRDSVRACTGLDFKFSIETAELRASIRAGGPVQRSGDGDNVLVAFQSDFGYGRTAPAGWGAVPLIGAPARRGA